MATQARIEANRRNAQKSTGPKTPAGKARSSANATKHGLTAKSVLIEGENGADFEAFQQNLLKGFGPASERGIWLVQHLAILIWRQKRAGAFEAACLEHTGPMASLKVTNSAGDQIDDVALDEANGADNRWWDGVPETEIIDRHARAARLVGGLRRSDFLGLIARYERAGAREIAFCLKELEAEVTWEGSG